MNGLMNGGQVEGGRERRREGGAYKLRYKFLENINKSSPQIFLETLVRTGYWLLFLFKSFWRQLCLYKKIEPLFPCSLRA